MKVSNSPFSSSENPIDLSPMLDVIFQLVLFFLVSTTFAVLPAIGVNLPESTTSSGSAPSSIAITCSGDGMLWLNGECVSPEELGNRLASFDTGGSCREEFPVSVNADSSVSAGTIVSVFDIVRSSGFCAVSLRTAVKK